MTRLDAVVSRLRGDRAEDSGFTMVEVVVALMLIGLIMSSFLAVTLTGVAANRVAEQRSRANQLAQQVMEKLKSVSWSELGFYSGDCGYPGTGSPAVDAAVSNEKVVVLGATRGADVAAPYAVYGSASCNAAAQNAMTLGGTSFQVTEHVTWTTPPGDDGSHQIKHITVVVAWTDHSKTRNVTVDATRAPTVTEAPPAAASSGAFAVTPSASGDQTLTSGGALTASIVLTVTTNSAASAVTASYPSTTGTKTATLTGDAQSTTWTVTLASASCCFNSGSEIFTFTGTRASDSTTAQGTAQVQLSAASVSYLVGTPTVNPTTVQLDASNYTTQSIGVTAVTTSGAGSVYIDYTDANGGNHTLVLTVSSTNNQTGNKTWTGTIPTAAGPITPGSLPIVFSASGASGTQTATVTISAAAPLAAVTLGTISLLNNNAAATLLCIDNSGNIASAHSYKVSITINNFSTTDTVALSNLIPSGSGANGLSLSFSSSSTSGGNATFIYTVGGKKLDVSNTMSFHISATRASDTQNVQSTTDPSWPIQKGGGC